jgi:tetratricopeptide (TPR) repeat protein
MFAVARGHLPAAKVQLSSLRGASDTVASIESSVLAAALARAGGNHDDEITALEHAVTAEDGTWYSEPPRFFYPVRESLGAAQFRAGRYADAEATFRADLERNPDNPRSLFGLAQTLGQEDRSDDAQAVQKRFAAASRQADVPFEMNDL